MKVYNPKNEKEFHPELVKVLEDIRKNRGFDAKSYVNKKANLLNIYMNRFGLSSCVVAVSGGVDSAVVLGLVNEAKRRVGSPIKKIVPVLLPISKSEGITNQDSATKRGEELCRRYGLEPVVLDLSDLNIAIRNQVDSGVSISGEGWAIGQLGPYSRTPILYYITSLLTQEGMGALICGTTNRDEGAYLGYVGKASDGMVDVQLISDLHKSEVYAIGRELNVTDDIMNVTPNGDMYDSRTDEDVFGAPYDFVELYLNYLNLSESEKGSILNSFGEDARVQFDQFMANLENLHGYNFHKYLAKSPAVHLDIYEACVKGGWDYDNSELWRVLNLDSNCPLWEKLGLDKDCSCEEVDLAYQSLKSKTRSSRLAWKVLRDRFYSKLYKDTLDLFRVIDAGFFDDGVDVVEKNDLSFLTTPVDKLNCGDDGEKIVLLSTGGFAPLHDGHVEMMELAKKSFSDKGFDVVGGYFSPCNDSYVSKKSGKPKCAEERINFCEKKLKDSDWLMVDPYEARYLKKTVNFTEVVDRLEKYLKKHVDDEIKVAYVFGSDNVSFMDCFREDGIGVCVERERNKFDSIKSVNERNVFVGNNSDNSKLESRKIRGEERGLVEEKKDGVYFIRNEGLRPFGNVLNFVSEKKVRVAQEKFLADLKKMFEDCFGCDRKFKILDVDWQLNAATSRLEGKDVISIDNYFEGKYNLDISRVFGISGAQGKPEEIVNRPEKESSVSNFDLIEDGNYVLLDDDSVSGNTLRMVKEKFPAGVNIDSCFMLSEMLGDKVFDVVDLRDFIVGSESGGLVVRLPNSEIARAPYVFPYVNLTSRASLDSKSLFDFSLKVWKMNLDFYESLNFDVVLDMVDNSFQKLMKYVGFDSDVTLIEICKWHIDKLEGKND